MMEISSEEKRRIRCRELMAGPHPPNRKIRDFGSVSGSEFTNREFGPISGPNSPQKTNSRRIQTQIGPKAGELAPENQSNFGPAVTKWIQTFCDFGPVSGAEIHPKSSIGLKVTKLAHFWSRFGVRSGPKSGSWAELGSESQNSTNLADLGPVSGPKSHQNSQLGPENPISGP